MKRVAVSPPPDALAHRVLLGALAEALAFEWVARDFDPLDSGVDAWVVLDAAKALPVVSACTRPCFLVSTGEAVDAPQPRIRFASSAALPAVLSGRVVELTEPPPERSLPDLPPGAHVLAEHAGRPIWAALAGAGVRHHITSLPVPGLAPGAPLYTLFDQDRFLGLLPLLAFLREATEDPGWEPPPLQACFMFDDPNLHWRSYGHLDFAALVVDATAHGYHVASATIPLDGWFVHRRTAELFRQHAEQISLLIHGNDHVGEELARRMTAGARAQMLAQALWRIGRLETRAGVQVSRVMAPPHGACSEESLAEMAALGYEAACVSRGSLRHYNPGAPWLATLGMRPCDVIRGLPVLPRFRMSPSCHNAILVAALLHQPIIPVGHHHDVAGGFDMLAQLADYIATLGPVRWGSMSRLARSQFSWRIDGAAMDVKMHTRRVDFAVPDGIREIRVADLGQPLRCLIDGAAPPSGAGGDGTFRVRAHQVIELHAGLPARVQTAAGSYAGPRPWPVIRRLLTETRDRVAPALRALS